MYDRMYTVEITQVATSELYLPMAAKVERSQWMQRKSEYE
jgi:hypothetical protein